MRGLKSVVIDTFLPFTRNFEGHTTWPYLDVRGLVTIGYGNLIDPNLNPLLDWRKLDGNPASTSEVQEGWRRIKNLQRLKDLGGYAFRDESALRVTEESLQRVCSAQLLSNYTVIKTHWLGDALDDWPASAQLALMSWAWANGPYAMGQWPHFLIACEKQDWEGCARECHNSTVGNPGVAPRNAANAALFTACLSPDADPNQIVGYTL